MDTSRLKSIFSSIANGIIEQTNLLLEIGEHLNSYNLKIDGKPIDSKIVQLQASRDRVASVLKNSHLLSLSNKENNSSDSTEQTEEPIDVGSSKINAENFCYPRKRKFESYFMENFTLEKRRRTECLTDEKFSKIFYDKLPLPNHLLESFMEICNRAKRLLPSSVNSAESRTTYFKNCRIICPLCQRQLLCHSIVEHLIHHGNNELRLIRCCPLCNRTFNKLFCLSQHMMLMHVGKEIGQ